MDVVLYRDAPARMRPTETLPPGGAQLVEEIFGSFPGGRPAYSNRSSWGGEAEFDFVFNPFGEGWHVDREAFDAALLELTGVRVIERRIRDVQAEFVIDATGRSARIARARGAKRVRLDRLVAAFEDDPCTDDLTLTAEENGWRYTAPGISAFLTDADLLPRGGTVTDASTSHLNRIAGEDWLAAGDAAVAFDPLSSQGIVTALLMGREAGRVAAGLVPVDAYVEQYGDLLREHLALKEAYYALETRWPDAPFWARRVQPVALSGAAEGQ
jgi:flavin-dependent dehydrogenase